MTLEIAVIWLCSKSLSNTKNPVYKQLWLYLHKRKEKPLRIFLTSVNFEIALADRVHTLQFVFFLSEYLLVNFLKNHNQIFQTVFVFVWVIWKNVKCRLHLNLSRFDRYSNRQRWSTVWHVEMMLCISEGTFFDNVNM